jgi:uncharacterized coiled-coil protein SlyX
MYSISIDENGVEVIECPTRIPIRKRSDEERREYYKQQRANHRAKTRINPKDRILDIEMRATNAEQQLSDLTMQMEDAQKHITLLTEQLNIAIVRLNKIEAR